MAISPGEGPSDGPTPPHKTCFIAMPISATSEHDKLYGHSNHWDEVLAELHIPAVEAAGYTAIPPSTEGTVEIRAEIIKHLQESDLVLVDLSGHNPNVFFELGVRTSLNKPVVLVHDGTVGHLPFDTAGLNTRTYDPALRAATARKDISELVKHINLTQGTVNPMWERYGLEIVADPATSDQSPTDAKLDLILRQQEWTAGRLAAIERAVNSNVALLPRLPPEHPPSAEIMGFADHILKLLQSESSFEKEVAWNTLADLPPTDALHVVDETLLPLAFANGLPGDDVDTLVKIRARLRRQLEKASR